MASKKSAWRVTITAFAPGGQGPDTNAHVVVKAESARIAADVQITKMRKARAIDDTIQPQYGASVGWRDSNGEGWDMNIGRGPEPLDFTHRLYVRPESMY